MTGREFITLVGGAATVWPFRTSAQQGVKVARIGILSPFSAADAKLWHQAFLSGLRDLGWVDGKNIVIEYRFADGQNDRLPLLFRNSFRTRSISSSPLLPMTPWLPRLRPKISRL